MAGFDFKFGFKGQGNMEWLSSVGKNKISVTTISKLAERDIKISSTHIRNLLASGKVHLIPDFLGRQYETSGNVLKTAFKDNRGNYKLIKIKIGEECYMPADGCYLTEVNDGQRLYKGICNTSGGNVLEILLFEFARLEAEEVTIKWLERKSAGFSEEAKRYFYNDISGQEATRVI